MSQLARAWTPRSSAASSRSRNEASVALVVAKQAVRLRGPRSLWDVELMPVSGDSAPVRFVLTSLDDLAARDVA